MSPEFKRMVIVGLCVGVVLGICLIGAYLWV